jgi:FtsZ-binding cell division protein ZapB
MSLGTWPLTTPAERDALAFLIQHLPCDGRYEVEIRKTPEERMTTDNLFDQTVDEELELLRAENADLKARLAEFTERLQELLQRLDEGDMPL